jgi:hypothetical protein
MFMQFDERDAEILARREAEFNLANGPRVGDFLRVAGGMLRFTHDWDDSLQTTVGKDHPCCGDASFYLGNDGYVSFSGSLDPSIDKTELFDTGEKQKGGFWFFHHDFQGAHRGVQCEMNCRVFERLKTMAGWHLAAVDLGKYLQIGDAVAEDMATYFLEVLPPATWRETLIQIGEPYSHVRGRATFATIYKKGGLWIWAGNCYRGEWTEPEAAHAAI